MKEKLFRKIAKRDKFGKQSYSLIVHEKQLGCCVLTVYDVNDQSINQSFNSDHEDP